MVRAVIPDDCCSIREAKALFEVCMAQDVGAAKGPFLLPKGRRGRRETSEPIRPPKQASPPKGHLNGVRRSRCISTTTAWRSRAHG